MAEHTAVSAKVTMSTQPPLRGLPLPISAETMIHSGQCHRYTP